MKNITFTADETLIRRAREKAAKENTTLNMRFREWLESYVSKKSYVSQYRETMIKLGYASPGKKFSREEMNRNPFV